MPNRLFSLGLVFCLAIVAVLSSTVSVAAQTEAPTSNTTAGLTISPLRTNPTVAAGESKIQKVTIQNRTARPMPVTLSYELFTLLDNTDDYKFSPPTDTIITFETNQFTLEPGASRAVAYQITIPSSYPPGGYYYTLFATNAAQNGSISTQSRVGSLVFLTVDGKLDRTTVIRAAKAPSYTMLTSIPVSIQLENTGNVHSENTITTSLSGMGMDTQTTTALHLVFPGSSRTFNYEIPAPRFPGIYTIEIDVNNGFDQPSATTLQVAYVPLWFVALVILLIVTFVSYARKRRTRKTKKSEETPDTDQNVSGTAV